LQPEELELDQIAPELISAGGKAIVDNAKRLGMTWTLRLATIVDVTEGAVTGIYDGDTVAIDMVSMIGPLAVGQRVYVVQVPPSGNFILGLIATVPYCHMTGNVTQLNGQGVSNPVNLNAIVRDTDNMADLANDRAIVRTAGLYMVTMGATWAAEATTYRGLLLEVNGLFDAVHLCFPAGAGQGTGLTLAKYVQLRVGDIIRVQMFQGVFVNQTGGYLQLRWVEGQ
jgi:hypothetical protein